MSGQTDIAIAALTEQLARQVQNLCFTRDLAPVQWSALRFFAQAGPAARTVSGLTTYSGVNQSSATRTVQLLEKKGLVEICQAGRFRRVSLTEKGAEALSRDPLQKLAAAVQIFDADEQASLRDMLAKLLLEMYPKPFKNGG